MTQKRERILFVGEQGDTPCGYYRCELPAKALRMKGYAVDVCHTLIELPAGEVTGLDHNRMQPTPVPDIVICRRINDPIPGTANDSGNFQSITTMVQRARKRKQRVYIDLDDDPWSLPEWNPAYGNMSEQQLEQWAQDMEVCDGVIVSTGPLQQSVMKHTTSVPVHVCRNGIDRGLFKYRRVFEPPIRLGWLGTFDYRARDLSMIVPALKEALQGRFGEVEFWHVGKNDDTDPLSLLGSDFPVQVRERKWLPITSLGQSLAEIDVAVIPMEDHPFNRARSCATGLALCAAGIPFVASDVPEYSMLWRYQAGYVVGEHDAWVQAIRMLTEKEYENVRSDIRNGGYAAAAGPYGLVATAAQYHEVFNG